MITINNTFVNNHRNRKEYLKKYSECYNNLYKKDIQKQKHNYYLDNKLGFIERAKNHYINNREKHLWTTNKNRMLRKLRQKLEVLFYSEFLYRNI